MDAALALVRLRNMVSADSRPTLSADDLQALLDAFRVPDRDGALINDAAWVPTWDLNAAAAEGWRWKAGRVAGDFTFSADDASYSKGDVLAHCESMVALYQAQTGLNTLGARDDRASRPYNSPRLVL